MCVLNDKRCNNIESPFVFVNICETIMNNIYLILILNYCGDYVAQVRCS